MLGTTFSVESLAAVHGGSTAPRSRPSCVISSARSSSLSTATHARPNAVSTASCRALIAEVAQATLARRDRSGKHLSVARHLESLEDDELTGLVAAHYVEAHRSAPEGPEADEIAAGARDWLSRAGKRALSLGSPEQALTFFEQALEVTTTGAERASLLELAGEGGYRASKYDRAVAHLEEAVAYYQAAGDANAAGRAIAKLIPVLGAGLSRYSEAAERGERAFEALRGERRRAGEGGPRLRTGRCPQQRRFAQASAGMVRDGARAGGALRRPGAARLGGRRKVRSLVQPRASSGGRHARPRNGGTRRCRRRAARAGDRSCRPQRLHPRGGPPRSPVGRGSSRRSSRDGPGCAPIEVLNLLNAAETSIYVGRWSDTRAAITELAQRELPVRQLAFLNFVQAMLEAGTGDAVAAMARFEGFAGAAAESESVSGRTTYLSARAFVNLASGDIEAARHEAAEAVAADPLGINSPNALAVGGRASLWLRDAEGARDVVAAMASFRGRWMRAERRTMEAGLAALEGRADAAADAYRESIEAWRALDCTLDLALCELDLVLLLGPDHPDATAAKEARDIFNQLGAKPFLERLDRAAGGGRRHRRRAGLTIRPAAGRHVQPVPGLLTWTSPRISRERDRQRGEIRSAVSR